MSVKLALAAVIAAAGLFATVGVSYADVATVIGKANIRKGPSSNAKKIGTLAAGASVEVDPDSCTNGFCQLANDFGPQGWISEDLIEFEEEEEPEEVAEACFYDKANFGGQSFCLEAGDIENKLSSKWNDRISSIEISGDISVDLCTDKNLYGLCGTFYSDVASLSSKLNNKVTSIEVSE
jgi:hypothetical protein